MWAGGWHLARDGAGFELSAGGVVGTDGAIVRFEGPTALEVARHSPHRLLELLADFTGSEMSELVLMIRPVEKNCVKMRMSRKSLDVRCTCPSPKSFTGFGAWDGKTAWFSHAAHR
jgi:hypothetical protein